MVERLATSRDCSKEAKYPLVRSFEDGLAAKIRIAMPDFASAVLVGSAVTRGHSVSDLDITAFSSEVPLGTDRAFSFKHSSKPVHIIAYHPNFFNLIFGDDTLYLLYYRELRKLREGHVLFDNHGIVKCLLKAFATKPPPRNQLRPVVSWLLANPEPKSRAEFSLAVERLTFCWLHLSPEYRYAKAKWLLEDSRGVRSSTLASLLEVVSQEFLSYNCPDSLAARLMSCGSNFLSAVSGPGHHFANNLADARALLAAGRVPDAVWPLRMAGAMLAAAWARELRIPYNGIGDLHRFSSELSDYESQLATILDDLFLLSQDVGAEVRSQYVFALKEFEKEWGDDVIVR